jgi:uncharacterized membrane protein YphA (DoxX/SURF4 family)
VIGPVLVGAVLLVWAGVAKVARPADTARALRAAGLPASVVLVRVLAGVEAVVGVAVIVVGGRALDAAMAVSYGVFAAFVGVAIARGWSLSSCGCFGEADARPTAAHVVVDAALAAAGVVAASRGVHPLAGMGQHPGQSTAVVVLSAVTAGLVVLTLTRLPALRAEVGA